MRRGAASSSKQATRSSADRVSHERLGQRGVKQTRSRAKHAKRADVGASYAAMRGFLQKCSGRRARMRIFVDESGSFAVPRTSGPRMCCVAGLAASDPALERLSDLHARLLRDWKPAGGELKGRNFSERNFERVLGELQRMDVLAVVVAIDMGIQNSADIAQHRADQANLLRVSVAGDEFEGTYRDAVHAFARRTEALSNQLYVQAGLQTDLLARTIRVATMLFAQTSPSSLGTFEWRIDAKGRTIQRCERLWKDLILPSLQTVFLREPHVYVEGVGFDYSAMEHFHNPTMKEPPKHLRGALRGDRETFESSDLRKFVGDIEFVDSKRETCVQFADVIASAFCRACNDEVGKRAWSCLAPLFVRYPLDVPAKAVEYRTMTRRVATPVTKQPYGAVVRALERGARDFEVRPNR